MPGGRRVAGTVAVTVHGPSGAVDLVVPPEAAALDVAREYAAQCRLGTVPALHTRLGDPLRPEASLSSAGVTTGDVLVATGAVRGIAAGSAADPGPPDRADPGPFSVLWFCITVALAGLTAWFASHASGAPQQAAVGLLVLSAFVGLLPMGRLAAHRMVAAPAFGAAAAFAVTWQPEPERLPTIIGLSALVAAVVAATGRALDERVDEAMRVWIVSGVLLFVVSGAGALIGFGPEVVWAVLLVLALLAARFVPGVAVDVPDQFLIDIERLAVSAWSARERPTGRRTRTVVPPAAVHAVAARGARLITASCAAVWVVVALSAPLLLLTATLPIDRIGARVLVFLTGAGLLLAARSYRHVAARALLRGAGLTCWASVLAVLLGLLGPGRGTTLAIAVIGVGALLVVVAVATGRGWRSAWWARRAEVAEALAGSFAIGSLVVAVGLFRTLWELKFRV